MLAGPPPESIEGPVVAVGRDRASLLTSALLLAIAAAAWVHVLSSARDATHTGGLGGGAGFVAAWAVMMAAMMLPSALPLIALYAATQRTAVGGLARAARVALFTLVYLGLWAATGIPIHVASVALPMIAADALPYGIAAVLLAAGLYQLSPLKRVCLRGCRSPLGFLLGHWREGWRGVLTMGWAHALYCLGCCWALMVVLVAAGAMGLPWVLLIAAAVAAEKLLPRGEWTARAIGAALMLLAVVAAVRPELLMLLRAGGHSM